MIHLSGDVVTADTDPIKTDDRGLRRLGNPSPVDVGVEARPADTGAEAVAGCTYHEQRRKFVAGIQLDKKVPEKTSERRKALLAFLRSYFPNALTAQGCTP